jgi:ParB family chromosome partitioning protein
MTTKGGLGRGLGSLIPAGASRLEELSPSEISPNPRQPRRSFDEESLADLAASIRQVGLLQPVVVRPSPDGKYELVLGERRWRASVRAGLSSVPAIVMETDDRGMLERALVENLHRRDLNAVEEAAAFQQLLEEAGLTHEELAERIGLSRPAISNSLRLLDLPAGVQRMIVEAKLTAGHGRALLGAAPGLVERLALRVAAEGLSVREAEELVRRSGAAGEALPSGDGGPPAPAGKVSPAGLIRASEALSDALGTRVKVTMGARKGKIVIEFGSVGDLDRIYQKIIGTTEGL